MLSVAANGTYEFSTSFSKHNSDAILAILVSCLPHTQKNSLYRVHPRPPTCELTDEASGLKLSFISIQMYEGIIWSFTWWSMYFTSSCMKLYYRNYSEVSADVFFGSHECVMKCVFQFQFFIEVLRNSRKSSQWQLSSEFVTKSLELCDGCWDWAPVMVQAVQTTGGNEWMDRIAPLDVAVCGCLLLRCACFSCHVRSWDCQPALWKATNGRAIFSSAWVERSYILKILRHPTTMLSTAGTTTLESRAASHELIKHTMLCVCCWPFNSAPASRSTNFAASNMGKQLSCVNTLGLEISSRASNSVKGDTLATSSSVEGNALGLELQMVAPAPTPTNAMIISVADCHSLTWPFSVRFSTFKRLMSRS